LASEIGFRVGRRRRPSVDDTTRANVSSVQAAMLGLLALLLGFTFALSAERFAARKKVVLDEANAIGTTYLRSRFLEEPRRDRVAALLRRYVDARIAFADTDEARRLAAERRIRDLDRQLWDECVGASHDATHPVLVGLFAETLNQLIDLDEKR